MNRPLNATFDALVRVMLVLALAFSPLAHPQAMAAAAPQSKVVSACPHHAKSAQHPSGSNQTKPGECCYKKGSACHCAMAIALPTLAMATLPATLSEHPVSAPRLIASSLTTPETPPPRG